MQRPVLRGKKQFLLLIKTLSGIQENKMGIVTGDPFAYVMDGMQMTQEDFLLAELRTFFHTYIVLEGLMERHEQRQRHFYVEFRQQFLKRELCKERESALRIEEMQMPEDNKIARNGKFKDPFIVNEIPDAPGIFYEIAR